MACRIRKSEYIIGIQVKTKDGNKNIHISQLADDTTLFLKSPTEIKPALKIIELFGKYSGILLNKLKTEGLWLGNLKACVIQIGGINWYDKPVKALGGFFGHDIEKCNDLIDLCKYIIFNWKKGKSHLSPKFTYLLHSLSVPKCTIDFINNRIFNFLWDGKGEKYKYIL